MSQPHTIQIGSFEVCRMGFGAMRITGRGAWGEPANIDLAKQVLKRATELGVNFFDTADAYGPEVSESLIHDTLAPYKRLVIATKGGYTRSGPGQWHPDGSPQHLRQAVLDSQRRLGVEQIQLYQLHAPDPKVPFQDSIRALADMQKQGLILHIGLSNVSLEQLKAARKIVPIVSVQNHYNLFYRRESEAILRYCKQQNIVFIPYYPVGGNSVDLANSELVAIAHKHLASPHQIMLAWLLAHSPAMLPIPGTGSIDHLEANIDALNIHLSSAEMRTLDRLGDNP